MSLPLAESPVSASLTQPPAQRRSARAGGSRENATGANRFRVGEEKVKSGWRARDVSRLAGASPGAVSVRMREVTSASAGTA